MPRSPLPRLRRICLALPETQEVEAWGAPTFRVRNKLFAMFAHAADHHGGGRNGVWIKAAHVTQDYLVRAHPDRYFRPPYVGPSGWVGAWLDDVADWDTVHELLLDAWTSIAPKRTVAGRAEGAPGRKAAAAPVKAVPPRKRRASGTATRGTRAKADGAKKGVVKRRAPIRAANRKKRG
jgi:hypothetical protein